MGFFRFETQPWHDSEERPNLKGGDLSFKLILSVTKKHKA